MKTLEPKLAAQATMFETYAPVERYFQEIKSRSGVPAEPPVLLSAPDAYLLHLLVGMHAQFRAVVDLAGAASWGATTLFWASQAGRCPVYAPEFATGCGISTAAGILREWLDRTNTSESVHFVPCGPDSENAAALIPQDRHDKRPVLVVVPLSPNDESKPAARLSQILEAFPTAILVLMSLGKIGAEPRLPALLDWSEQNDLRLAALRELSPFLAASGMAVAFPSQDTAFIETLKRIERLFTSNFDFLTLARQTYTLSMANGKLQTQLNETRAKNTDLENSLRAREALAQQTQRETDAMAQRIEDLHQSAHWWAKECERVVEHATQLEKRLHGLTNGRAWRVVKGLNWLRQTLAPRNSMREHVARSLVRLQRRLRGLVPAAR